MAPPPSKFFQKKHPYLKIHTPLKWKYSEFFSSIFCFSVQWFRTRGKDQSVFVPLNGPPAWPLLSTSLSPSSTSSSPSPLPLVNCPTRWSLLFIFGFLYWSSSWRLGPHIGVCRLLWPLLRAGMAVLTHFFLQNFLYVSRSQKKIWATFFWFYPPETAVFSERV